MAKLARNPTVSLEHSSDGGTTWVVVPGILSFDIGNITAEEIDATDADSTGSFKEYINGYLEASEGSIVVHNKPRDATLMALRTAQSDGTVEDFRAKIDGEYTTFTALVKGYSEPVEIGSKLVLTITIKLTGAPVYAAVT